VEDRSPAAGAATASPLCSLDALPDGREREGREIEARVGGRSLRLFLVRIGGEVRAYVNRCPHRGSPLNWLPDRFLAEDREHAICATHGAVFRIEDGRCVAGPCRGEFLERVAVVVEDGLVRLAPGARPTPGPCA